MNYNIPDQQPSNNLFYACLLNFICSAYIYIFMQPTSSFSIVDPIITHILNESAKEAHIKQLIRTQLPHFCYKQSIKYSGQIYKESFRQAQMKQECILQKQPNPLIHDNFFPTAAAIDEPQKTIQDNQQSVEKKQKKLSRNKTQNSISQVSLTKKITKKDQQSPFEQLQLPPRQQEQAILKQLRKQVQEQANKSAEQQGKKKEEKTKKKEGKQQRIGYDFNGDVIKLKSENRNNLISGGLDGETLKSVQKTKEVKKNTQSTNIQYERKDKKFNKLVRNGQVQFTDIKTLLSEARATKGVKMIEQGRIIEQKKKAIAVKQLMKTLNGRKLTKQQYRKIKQVSGNVAPYDDYSITNKSIHTITSEAKNESIENISQLRSASESKLSNSLTRRKSTITVSDPQLLQNLIAGADNQVTYKQSNAKNDGKEDKLDVKFDSNDYYNLEYMKKGGSLQIKKSKSTADLSDIKLPKIESNRQQMPRIRQKLKDKQEIVRAIRKKFEDKLRI